MAKQKIIPAYDLYKTLGDVLGFELCRLEEAYNPYDATLPHRHNYFEVLFFNGTGGNHEIDFTAYPIKANTLHFISPEQVHLLRRARHVTGYVISFSKDFCHEGMGGTAFIESFPFFNNPYAAPIISPGKPNGKILEDLIGKIKTEYFSKTTDKADVLSAYLTVLLVTAKRLYKPQSISGKTMPPRSELTRRFKQAVENNFMNVKSVADYSKLLSITSGHLNDTVHHDTGRTASEIIHERITLEAKRLLYRSEKSVKEIAYSLGYDDPSYFVKFFKSHVLDTPENFRKHIREKYH